MAIILGGIVYIIIGRVFTQVLLKKKLVKDPLDFIDIMGWLLWPFVICYLIIRIVSDFFINLFI